jgi:hypothetical protein
MPVRQKIFNNRAAQVRLVMVFGEIKGARFAKLFNLCPGNPSTIRQKETFKQLYHVVSCPKIETAPVDLQ